jgi:LysM repeat protein/phage host-nuclease inhibitor protein Gam
MAEIPTKLYTMMQNGIPTLSALPSYNIQDSRYSEVSDFNQLYDLSRQVLDRQRQDISNLKSYGMADADIPALQYYNQLGGDSLYQKLTDKTASVEEMARLFGGSADLLTSFNSLRTGTPVNSGYIMSPDGKNMTTQATIDEQSANEAAVLAGTMKNIGTAERPLYVPTGSAADLQAQGKTMGEQLATPSVQAQIKTQGLTPVAPVIPQTLGNMGGVSGGVQGGGTYKIQSGDTLSAIAAKNGTTVQALMQSNPGITDPNKIYAGQSIVIPGTGGNEGGGTGTGGEGGASGGVTGGATGGDTTGGTGEEIIQQQSPSNFIETYKKALDDVGVSSIKKSYEDAIKEHTDLTTEMNDKIADINENPWMSQSVRNREIARVQSRYETRLNTLVNEQQLFDSLYKQGVAEAKYLTTGAIEEQNALIEATQRAEEAKAKLQQQAIDSKQSALKIVNGGLFDTDTRTWVITPDETSGGTDKLLSVTEAASLGVPYGTTESQAYGLVPQGKTTQAQETVAGFATRIEQSNDILNSLKDTIKNYNPVQFAAEMLSPTSYLKTSIIQQYDQASRNIINAILRRESGAVISDQEFDNARKQYLPQPGDTDKTINQKQENVLSVLNSYKSAAGNAYQSVNELLSGGSGQTSSGIKYTIE